MENGMIKESVSYDLVVVGGGVTGCVAVIAAARLGLRVALLQNRPVLGGPSGSETCPNADGSFLRGASDYTNANARECGILEELRLEARYRKSVGYEQHWSILLREWVEREPNIDLRMNTEVFEVEASDGSIKSVTGRTLGSEITLRYRAPLFIDCSGDSFVGYAAGAEYRHGREAASEYGESLAPEKADNKTMGSTIGFRAIDTGSPVPFEPPSWAMKLHGEEHFRFRPHDNVRQGYWWLEYGGELDTIGDNEAIYRKLLSILFGVWDHIKNHGDHGAENLAIEWIASIPCKRESRRLIGDHILTQGDIENKVDFPDAIAYGGWPFDLHPPEGFFAEGHPGFTPPFVFPGIYKIPYRCLYSRNISNLLMAGRNISATHVALGTTRVMATCALLGQAAGTAAVLCHRYNMLPMELGKHKIGELQELLGREDSVLPGAVVLPPDNLAAAARVTAESAMTLATPVPITGSLSLIAPPRDPDYYDPADFPPEDRRRAQMFPVSENRLNSLTLFLNNRNPKSQLVRLTLHRSAAYNDFRETPVVAAAEMEVAPGENLPIVFTLNADVVPDSLYHIVLAEVEGVDVCTGSRYLPGLYCKADGSYPTGHTMAFVTEPPQRVFEPANVTNGLTRAGDWPNMWISDPDAALPQSITLELDSTVRPGEVELIFDTNLHLPTVRGVPPVCARDYQIHLRNSEGWHLLCNVEGNRTRRRRHLLKDVDADAIRLTIIATHGDPSARLYEIRVFPAENAVT